MEFRYKGFDVSVEKRSDGLFRWYACSDDVTLGDREGGDLKTYTYAKYRIKRISTRPSSIQKTLS
jgi:hypothetical protein